MKFEIWSEGYAKNSSDTARYPTALFHGTAEGADFQEACGQYANVTPHFNKFFDKDALTYWGLKLFSNQKDASDRSLQLRKEYDLQQAVKTVTTALREDGGYYMSWQANIAMAFYDEYRKAFYLGHDAELHTIFNRAAKYFLDNLLRVEETVSEKAKRILGEIKREDSTLTLQDYFEVMKDPK